MLQSDELPEELNISLGSENREFAVKGTFAQPVIASGLNILFGAGWLGFTFLLMSFFLAPGFIRMPSSHLHHLRLQIQLKEKDLVTCFSLSFSAYFFLLVFMWFLRGYFLCSVAGDILSEHQPDLSISGRGS